MDSVSKKIVVIFANIGYITGCICLYIFALWIIGSAIWGIISDLIYKEFTVFGLLDVVGNLVFSIAVIDVCKYLMVEEVLRQKAERPPHETRRAFTKFVIIIATALSLEGLVLTIEIASKGELQNVPYSMLLFLVATLLVVGVGIYQKLNSSSEGK